MINFIRTLQEVYEPIIYYTWVDAKALITNIAIVIAKFLYEYILTKFGCPLTIVIN
jgi:hypothetical protein